MSGTTELLGDPEILTNDCTAPMGIAFPTAMIVPAPHVLRDSRTIGSVTELMRGEHLIRIRLRTDQAGVASRARNRWTRGRTQRIIVTVRSPARSSRTRSIATLRRRARIVPFVDDHFSFSSAWALHRRALGRDLLRAPVNVMLVLPQVVLLPGAAALARRVGWRRADERARNCDARLSAVRRRCILQAGMLCAPTRCCSIPGSVPSRRARADTTPPGGTSRVTRRRASETAPGRGSVRARSR